MPLRHTIPLQELTTSLLLLLASAIPLSAQTPADRIALAAWEDSLQRVNSVTDLAAYDAPSRGNGTSPTAQLRRAAFVMRRGELKNDVGDLDAALFDLAQDVSDSLLRINAFVQIRVPALRQQWFRGHLVRSSSLPDCIAVMLDPEAPGERQRFVFLGGVDSLLVDRRTNLGAFVLNAAPPEATNWQIFSRAELKRANAGCTGRRRPGLRPAPPM